MEAERRVVLAHAVADDDIVRLLETEAVAVEVSHRAILDDGAETAVEEDAPAAAAVEMRVVLLVAVNGHTLDAAILEVVTADDGEERCGRRAVAHHAVGIERFVEGECVAVATCNARDGRVEAVGILVPNRHAAADVETRRYFHGRLFLAVVAIAHQRR